MNRRSSLSLQQTPLLLPLICLMTGMMIGWWGLAVGVWVVLVVAAWMARSWPVVQSLLIGGAFVVTGMMNAPAPDSPLPQGQWMEGVVADMPAEKPKTMAVEVMLPAEGKTQHFYFRKDSCSRSLRITDGVRLRLSHEGWFVNSRDWQRGGNAREQLSRWQRIRLWCMVWRQQLLQHYRQLDADETEYAILSAMTLGSRSALTPEMRDVFNVSGAGHVLALSGLHLGIIFWLLSRLLFVRRFWVGRALLVCALWGFAFLTGLSPSIVRSAAMLTVFTLFIGRSYVSFNALCLAAILLLLFDNRSLFDMGFQMSFASVGAILIFMPVFERFLPKRWQRHKLLWWPVTAMAVSVAAQIGAAPLVAYYFGRFSTYFLLTNLFVIPATMLILITSLLLLVLPCGSLGVLLTFFVRLLNWGLSLIAGLPLASIEGLHPSVTQVVLLYLLAAVAYRMLRVFR